MKKIISFSKEIPFKTRIAEITDIEVSHNLEKTPLNTIEGNFLVNGTYKMTEASQVEEKFSHDLPFTIEVDEKYDLSEVKIKISDFFFEILNEDVLKVNIELELSEVKEREFTTLDEEVNRFFEEIEEEEEKEATSKIELEEQEAKKEEEENIERCYDEEEGEIKEPEEESDIIMPLEQKAMEKEEEKAVTDIMEPIDILDSEIPKALDLPPKETEKELEIEKTKPISSNKPITDIFTSINNDEDSFKSYYVYIVRENDTLEEILNRYKITKEEAAQYNDFNDIKLGTKLILPCANNE